MASLTVAPAGLSGTSLKMRSARTLQKSTAVCRGAAAAPSPFRVAVPARQQQQRPSVRANNAPLGNMAVQSFDESPNARKKTLANGGDVSIVRG